MATTRSAIVTEASFEVPKAAAIDVTGAITELHTALDNFVTQLHYTVTKTQGTHVYKALVRLGGVWNGVGKYS
jgi:hypothetical protein